MTILTSFGGHHPEEKFVLCLIEGIHFFLTFNIGTPGSWAFGLRPGLVPLAPLVLRT
jgi:hypothetical protein